MVSVSKIQYFHSDILIKVFSYIQRVLMVSWASIYHLYKPLQCLILMNSNKEAVMHHVPTNKFQILVIWYCLDDLDLDASENLSCSKSDITALFDITTVRNNGRPRFYFNKLLWHLLSSTSSLLMSNIYSTYFRDLFW